jgi:hypothetical protein
MRFVLFAGLLSTLLALTPVQAENSAFTYQGRLVEKGRTANGTYDFQFRLVDAPTNGNYVGSTISLSDVAVTNGIFTVLLDFGSSAFDGFPRLLETAVRTNGTEQTFTILQPLQPITVTPYAMLANTALTAGVASNLVSGAVLTNLSIAGNSIQLGTITSAQMDPATDASYRSVDTNAIRAIVAEMAAVGLIGNAAWADAKLVFGARGDGVTDDTAAIQAGLDYLASPIATNRTLYLPAGTYRLTRPLHLPTLDFPTDPVAGIDTGWRIAGAGRTATRLFWPGLRNGIGLALTNGVGYEGVTIEDLAILGPQMTSWDTGDRSIGLALGAYTETGAWSGYNNMVRNCTILGWGVGATATNQWELVFDNCTVASNHLEGLRFVGSHNVSVQNCRIFGGWDTACGIGIGFHPPLNAGFGDNAQILNCFIMNCTNGILNQELNLTSLNNHLEACSSYYTLVSPWFGIPPPATTIIGGYTLDWRVPTTNGFPAQMLIDGPSAPLTVIINTWFTGGNLPWRPVFNVTNIVPPVTVPIYLGPGSLSGLWNSVSNITVYPAGSPPQGSAANQGSSITPSLPQALSTMRHPAASPHKPRTDSPAQSLAR